MKYIYWLHNVPGIGDVSMKKLLEAFGTAEDIYTAKEASLKELLKPKQIEALRLQQRLWDVDREYDLLQEKGIKMTCLNEEAYPDSLRQIPDPPRVLYYKGKLPKAEGLSVALIGARECSEYGKYLAIEIGKALALHGIQVISGMARGIDGIGQNAALEAGGESFGVLGCGVDICYPKSNQSLYQELIKRGGVLSGVCPGTPPNPQLFPPRNRIVSGLCDALLVIEARQKSGTLITVDMALEQGREVYAVPGRVTDRLSDGCNKLIKDGASAFLTPEQFIEEITDRFSYKKWNTFQEKEGADKKQKSNRREISSQDMEGNSLENQILEVLDFYPRPLESIHLILQEKGYFSGSEKELLTQIMLLCIQGKAIQNSTNWFSKSIANHLKT